MGLLYDRNLDDGRGQVPLTEIPLDGSQVHITQYNPANHTHWSWDTNGDLNTVSAMHPTIQNVPPGDPSRHQPPP
jgi:hypothetical protein